MMASLKHVSCALCFLVFASSLPGCTQEGKKTSDSGKKSTISTADPSRVEAAKNKLWNKFLSNPSILGVGVGRTKSDSNLPILVVYVDKSASKATIEEIPSKVDGVPTRIVRNGRFRANEDSGQARSNSQQDSPPQQP